MAERIKYHPAFASGIELLLWDYQSSLHIETEHNLSREPLRMDVLIIKKKKDVAIDYDIGRIFKTHNIIEYKSPQDSLSIDEYCKALAYAFLYKSLGKTVEEIPLDDISVSIFRHTHPRELFKSLERYGASVVKKYPGIYNVSGLAPFQTQIVVTKELDKKTYPILRVLVPNADEEDIREFILQTAGREDAGFRRNVDAVYQVSVSSNKKTYEKISKEDPTVCDALKDLMRDDFAAARNEGLQEGLREGLNEGEIIGTIRTYHRMNVLPSEIVKNIMADYSLSRDVAETYLERTLNLQKV